jgi:ribosomal peptide maturation radical SAM protein 1
MLPTRYPVESRHGSPLAPPIEKRMPGAKPRVALIYAPFGACNHPALGISLLKSGLAREGIPCDIHYLNLVLARELGTRICDLIAIQLRSADLVGEWLFAPALLGDNPGADSAYVQQVLWGDERDTYTPAVVLELLRIRQRLPGFLDDCLERVDWSAYDWIGFSSSFHQQCASLALAWRIKTRFPHVRIVFGGANCTGAMGAALGRLFPFVDYVCTGYGDMAFPMLVRAVAGGDALPAIPGIVTRQGGTGTSLADDPVWAENLDSLPYPDYSDYLEQLKTVGTPPNFEMQIPMETSRGCWWGQKRQCTFCGFNAAELAFRCKSPDRILDELRCLAESYGEKIFFTDNVLSRGYFHTVIPELACRPGPSLTWEVRANLTRDQIRLLADAGVTCLQPGIESLSDPILKLMRKGTTVAHNIQLLKWAKQYGITVSWNLLWGFPGEDLAEYAAMQQLMRLLRHLDPPTGYAHIRFDRYGAYFADPAAHGITQLRPARPYRAIYYSLAEEDLSDLAFHFDAEYSDASPVYAQGMRRAVRAWQACGGAALDLYLSPGAIRIVDTRSGAARELAFDGLAANLYLLCDAAQTVRALMEAPGVCARASETQVVELLDDFVEQGLMIRAGRQYLSLAVVREFGRQEHSEP